MIENHKRLKDRLRKAKEKYIPRGNTVSVSVGYRGIKYALYVHESVEMKLKGLPRRGKDHKGRHWDPQSRAQAKFLEQPFRDRVDELEKIIVVNLKATGDMEMSLFAAGEILQGWSQKLAPVEFGFLKASAFTEVDK